MKDYAFFGEGFVHDISPNAQLAGDSNTFPHWCELSTKAKKSIDCIRNLGLDQPMPLLYYNSPVNENAYNLFAQGYESSKSIWLHLGLAYLDVVKKHQPKLMPA
ncbi:MAG: hypothetical protein ABIH34_01215 [Nanoarchaeota archaeon]